MTSHTFYKYTDCENPHCNFCVGGLAYCTVCEGAEGLLPTECPGEPMDSETENLVYNEAVDFIGGKWVRKP